MAGSLQLAAPDGDFDAVVNTNPSSVCTPIQYTEQHIHCHYIELDIA